MSVPTIRSGPAWGYGAAGYWYAAALIVLLGVLHIVLVRGLYADGSYFLLKVLSTQTIWNNDTNRITAHIVYQLPVIAAIWAGAENLKVLARIHTFALVLPMVLLYLGALWKVRANAVLFGAFVLIIVIAYQNLNFMAISESNLLYAAATLALALLVQDRDFSLCDSLLLIVCAIICVRAYEAAIFLGPLLSAACVARMIRSRSGGHVALGLSALLFAAGWGFAVMSVLAPRHPENFHNAVGGVFRMNRQLWLSCVLAAAYAGYVLVAARAVRVAMIAIFAAVLVALAFPANWALPPFHYHSRVAGGLALLAIGAVLIAFRFSRLSERAAADRRRGHARLLVLAPLLALTVSAVPDIVHSIGWKRFLNSFERVVNGNTDLIDFDAARTLLKKESLYGWGWTYPCMSLLLRHGPQHAIILNPGDGTSWQPFDPGIAGSLPDLHQYRWE